MGIERNNTTDAELEERMLLVSLGDDDYGIMGEAEARRAGHQIADAVGMVVRLRDIITDRTLVVVRPAVVVRR
jgi:hypothetical protein